MNRYFINCWIIFFLMVFPSITSCNDVPLGEYRIEWDDNDPSLHGHKVHFSKPMRYVLLENRHIVEYPKEEVEIGRILSTEDMVFEPGGYAKSGFVSESIRDGMEFTILASYWYRGGKIEREFFGDKRSVIMADESGTKSVMSFVMFMYSDKPEFYELKNEGRFK